VQQLSSDGGPHDRGHVEANRPAPLLFGARGGRRDDSRPGRPAGRRRFRRRRWPRRLCPIDIPHRRQDSCRRAAEAQDDAATTPARMSSSPRRCALAPAGGPKFHHQIVSTSAFGCRHSWLRRRPAQVAPPRLQVSRGAPGLRGLPSGQSSMTSGAGRCCRARLAPTGASGWNGEAASHSFLPSQ